MSHEFHRRSNCHQLWLIRMIWSEKQFSLSENQVPLKCDHPSFKWLTSHYSMNDLSLNFAQHCSPYYHTLWGFGVGWGPTYWRSHHFQHVLGKNWDISFEIRRLAATFLDAIASPSPVSEWVIDSFRLKIAIAFQSFASFWLFDHFHFQPTLGLLSSH